MKGWRLQDVWNLPVEYYDTLVEMVQEQNEHESAASIEDLD